MADTTPNIGLRKPLESDFVSVDTLNENMEKIDEAHGVLHHELISHRADYETHVGDNSNPHFVTSAQVNYIRPNQYTNDSSPSSFPLGHSVMKNSVSGAGFPAAYGILNTYRADEARYVYQIYSQISGLYKSYKRSALADDRWGEWNEILTSAGGTMTGTLSTKTIDHGSGYITFTDAYVVNVRTPAELLDYDGQPLNNSLSYRVQLITMSTATRTGALYFIIGNGSSFELKEIYTRTGTDSNKPSMYLDENGTPMIRTNHGSHYTVAVKVERVPNRGAPWLEYDGIWTAGNAGPFYKGVGSPEGFVIAPVGSLYQRADGGSGTALYVKQSGTGNTGWVAK